MSEITKLFAVPFSDELSRIIKQNNRTAVTPLVLANKAAISECLNLRFSLKSIYDAWMAHYGDKPLFSYTAFRRACIRLGLYQTKSVERAPDIEPAKLGDFLNEPGQDDQAKPVLETPKENSIDIESALRRSTTPGPTKKISIVHKPVPIKDLPDNSVPTFSNDKNVD